MLLVGCAGVNDLDRCNLESRSEIGPHCMAARMDTATLLGHICVGRQAQGLRAESGEGLGKGARRTVQVEGTQVKGRNDMDLWATDSPRGKPRGAGVGHPHSSPASASAGTLGKRTHLRKQWAAETSQRELMRTAPQTCKPWYIRLACHGHWPATTS